MRCKQHLGNEKEQGDLTVATKMLSSVNVAEVTRLAEYLPVPHAQNKDTVCIGRRIKELLHITLRIKKYLSRNHRMYRSTLGMIVRTVIDGNKYIKFALYRVPTAKKRIVDCWILDSVWRTN